jgi:glycosyltransferase involved in cell wall biosynthesis
MIMDVTLLLATYNGEKYIKEQLETIINQKNINLKLIISDDTSNDSTIEVIKKFFNESSFKNFTILKNPDNSKIINNDEIASVASYNFRNLILHADLNSDFYTFSDQDDIWDLNKIKHAIDNISDNQSPALYCSKTTYVDKNKDFLGFSKSVTQQPCFANALVESIAGGNTMVFNKLAMIILKKSLANASPPAHDWWTYIIISGCGGKVYYDSKSYIKYRLHDDNLTGANLSFNSFFKRLRKAFAGNYKQWNNLNIRILKDNENLLTDSSKKTLDYFIHAKNSNFLKKYSYLTKSGAYRNNKIENILLYLACMFGKM